MLAEPFLARIGRVALPILAGSGALLLPGSLVAAWQLRKKGRVLLPLVWALFQILLYAWRLPVTYQHGRYLQPVLPVLAVYGVGGCLAWLRESRPASRLRRVVGQAWLASIFILSLVFCRDGNSGLTLGTFRLSKATWCGWPAGCLRTAGRTSGWRPTDIGALGYFAGRPILDPRPACSLPILSTGWTTRLCWRTMSWESPRRLSGHGSRLALLRVDRPPGRAIVVCLPVRVGRRRRTGRECGLFFTVTCSGAWFCDILAKTSTTKMLAFLAWSTNEEVNHGRTFASDDCR